MYLVAYRCTQCPVMEKWYEHADATGVPIYYNALKDASVAAWRIARASKTVCRVIEVGTGLLMGETQDFRRVK